MADHQEEDYMGDEELGGKLGGGHEGDEEAAADQQAVSVFRATQGGGRSASYKAEAQHCTSWVSCA